MAIANALQLEATWAKPVLFCFNYDAMPSLKSLKPIHRRIIVFLLLIHYIAMWSWPWTLWPWTLTVNI